MSNIRDTNYTQKIVYTKYKKKRKERKKRDLQLNVLCIFISKQYMSLTIGAQLFV